MPPPARRCRDRDVEAADRAATPARTVDRPSTIDSVARREALAERRDQRHGQQPAHAGRQADREPARPARRRSRSQVLARALHLVQDAAAVREQPLAGLGGRGAAAVARTAGSGAARPRAGAPGGSAPAARRSARRRAGEAAELGDAHEVFELLQVHAHADITQCRLGRRLAASAAHALLAWRRARQNPAMPEPMTAPSPASRRWPRARCWPSWRRARGASGRAVAIESVGGVDAAQARAGGRALRPRRARGRRDRQADRRRPRRRRQPGRPGALGRRRRRARRRRRSPTSATKTALQRGGAGGAQASAIRPGRAATRC